MEKERRTAEATVESEEARDMIIVALAKDGYEVKLITRRYGDGRTEWTVLGRKEE